MTQIDLEEYIAELKKEEFPGDLNLIYKEEKERSIWADGYYDDLIEMSDETI